MAMDIAKTIEDYNRIHDAAYQHMRDNPEILGNMQWLRPAISEGDFQISETQDGILCYGTSYTLQTQDHESFEFQISYTDLLLTLLRMSL